MEKIRTFIDFGVCRSSNISVMTNAGWGGNLAGEILFGEPYGITGKPKSGWLPVYSEPSGSEGWIPASIHHGITEDYFALLSSSDHRITLDVVSNALFKKSTVHILMGSLLPLTAGELFQPGEQLVFNGEAKTLSQKRDAEFLCSIAQLLLNTPERPGGRTPFGMDAYGWIRLVFRIAGYALPIASDGLMLLGKEAADADATMGDLVYLEAGKDKRIGLLIKDRACLYCDGLVRVDQIKTGGIFRENQTKPAWKVQGYRRILT